MLMALCQLDLSHSLYIALMESRTVFSHEGIFGNKIDNNFRKRGIENERKRNDYECL